MYPRNAASPPPIAIGQVVQISDGAVQTTGASVRVSTGTGAYAAGSGTLACDTTSGIWSYTPTQGETNDTVIRIAVYKTSCLGCAATVVTTASATSGKVVLSGETHTSAVVPTVTTLTNAPSDSSGVTTLLTRIVGTLATGTHQPQTGDGYALLANVTYGLSALKTLIDAIKAKTDNLPSDPADASDIAAAFGTVNATLATIAGYIDTEVAAIKAKTDNLPATPASTSDIPSAATIADAVWDEAMSGHTTSGTYGGRIVRATNSNVAVQITGLNHVAADVHEFQAGVITAGDFATDSITSTALAASAVAEIVTGILTTAMTEAYRSTNAAPTVAQALLEILQNLTEFAISGTTKTVKKLDGSTTAKTYTLDSATTPTSITEAT